MGLSAGKLGSYRYRRYEDAGSIYCSFCFEIKNWGKSIIYDKLGGADSLTQKFTFNGPRTVHFTYTFDPAGDLDPNTYVEYGPNVYIGGNVYNFVYY